MNQLIPVSLSYKRRPFDAMDGMSSDASYNILGANKNSFDKSLTIFYINV